MIKKICPYENIDIILKSKKNFEDFKLPPIHSSKRYIIDDIEYKPITNPIKIQSKNNGGDDI